MSPLLTTTCDCSAPIFKVPGEGSLLPAWRSCNWQWITGAASQDSLRKATWSKQQPCCYVLCSQPMQPAPRQPHISRLDSSLHMLSPMQWVPLASQG